MEEHIRKPSWFLYLTEAIRAFIDLIRCLWFLKSYRYAHIGDARPIVVIPGLTASDLSMTLLRRFLKKHGFTNVYPWGLGRNLGDLNNIAVLSDKIEKLYAQHQQKVTLIGWSLGGVFAREIAKQKPHMVHQLITMGSPFGDPQAPNHARWVFEYLQDVRKIDKTWETQIPLPAPIPTTAIYSKQDGIVPWETCKEAQEDVLHRNIEVRGSHFGLPVNSLVFRVLIEALEAKNTEGGTYSTTTDKTSRAISETII
jgi:hypothetical protein